MSKTHAIALALFCSTTLLPTPLLAADPPSRPSTPTPPAAPSGPPAGHHEVSYATSAGAGEPKEVKGVLDTPHLKLASITLRKGTVLAEHAAPMPVTIMAVSGAGHVVVGEKKLRVEPGKLVALAPHVAHSVVPDVGTDLVLLVHHMKQGPTGPGPKGQGPRDGHGPGPREGAPTAKPR